MAGISPEALAGYILEELLAYLLRNAGYRLLTDASQDPQDLANRHHGLVINGRGAEHQVDVLGELLWIPAFTYPLRLVLEAKCRKSKTDIGTVRSMVGALLDINQNNMPNRPKKGRTAVPRPKYAYVGAIFSAAGFSSPAADFALAHAISLIDLRAHGFQGLVQSARECGATLSERYRLTNMNEPEGPRHSAGGFVRAVRDSLRLALETPTVAPVPLVRDERPSLTFPIESAVRTAKETGELFIGMASGPYMLVLKADNPERFLQYANERPTHAIEIRWSRAHDNGQTWNIVPLMGRQAYELSFKLPERLSDWIFGSENVRQAAAEAKQVFLSSITIYRKEEHRDQLIRLTYDPRSVPEARS